MKITNIREEEGIYFVTYTPSFTEKLAGKRTKEIRYKMEEEKVYTTNNKLNAVIRADGEIMGADSEEVKKINNHKRSF